MAINLILSINPVMGECLNVTFKTNGSEEMPNIFNSLTKTRSTQSKIHLNDKCSLFLYCILCDLGVQGVIEKAS